MVKRHLKRLATPKTWQIKRKDETFVTRPRPGAHALNRGLPLVVVLRDKLGIAKTTKEAKKILINNDILVDKVRRKDSRLIVGLMDTVSIPAMKQYYRIIINQKGKLDLKEIDEKETGIKPDKIIGKTMIKKKIQLNLFDGKNVLSEKDVFSVGDSVLLDLSKKGVKQHLKLQKGCSVLLIGGKSIGHTGEVDKIDGNRVFYKANKGTFETHKKYIYVIGGDKAAISL